MFGDEPRIGGDLGKPHEFAERAACQRSADQKTASGPTTATAALRNRQLFEMIAK